jgi:tetratricopeptide (TPR) repeat protein
LVIVLQRQHRFEDAQAAAKRGLTIRPRYAPLHHQLGDALTASGDFAGAVQAYQTAISLDSGHADIRGSLALATARLGRLDESLAIMEEALALAPRNPHLLAKKSYLLVQAGNLAEARNAAEMALAAGPDLAGVHATLGDVLERQGDTVAALAAYRKAAELEPLNAHFRALVERLSNAAAAAPDLQAAE